MTSLQTRMNALAHTVPSSLIVPSSWDSIEPTLQSSDRSGRTFVEVTIVTQEEIPATLFENIRATVERKYKLRLTLPLGSDNIQIKSLNIDLHQERMPQTQQQQWQKQQYDLFHGSSTSNHTVEKVSTNQDCCNNITPDAPRSSFPDTVSSSLYSPIVDDEMVCNQSSPKRKGVQRCSKRIDELPAQLPSKRRRKLK